MENPNGRYSSLVQGARNLKHGRRSKIVKKFLESKGVVQIEPAETSSILKWANDKLDIWKRKLEFQNNVVNQLKTPQKRALGWLSQMIDLSMKSAALEEELLSKGVNPITDDNWMRNQMMIAKLREKYDAAEIDLEKTKVEQQLKNEDDNILFTNTVIDDADKPD